MQITRYEVQSPLPPGLVPQYSDLTAQKRKPLYFEAALAIAGYCLLLGAVVLSEWDLLPISMLLCGDNALAWNFEPGMKQVVVFLLLFASLTLLQPLGGNTFRLGKSVLIAAVCTPIMIWSLSTIAPAERQWQCTLHSGETAVRQFPAPQFLDTQNKNAYILIHAGNLGSAELTLNGNPVMSKPVPLYHHRKAFGDRMETWSLINVPIQFFNAQGTNTIRLTAQRPIEVFGRYVNPRSVDTTDPAHKKQAQSLQFGFDPSVKSAQKLMAYWWHDMFPRTHSWFRRDNRVDEYDLSDDFGVQSGEYQMYFLLPRELKQLESAIAF